MFEDALPVLPVQLKPKRFAEGRQRPFCGIGLSRLESNVVHFTRRVATALAGTMTFTDDRRAIGLHGNAHLGDVDRAERAAVFSCEDAARLDSFTAPGIKAEDPIGFRDREPAFDVCQFAAMGLARADLPAIEVTTQRLQLFC